MAFAVAVAMQRVPGVRAVESPATSALFVPTPEGFAVRRAAPDGRPAADCEQLGERAKLDPLWVGSLISADGQVGAIVIELASSQSEVSVAVLHALRQSLAPWEARGFEFALVGDPVELVIAGGDLQADSQRLVPLIALLIGAMLRALFRSLRVALAALATVAVATLWSFGLMGWLGWPQTAVTQALAPFIAVVGICNAVHLIARYACEVEPAGAPPGATRTAAMLAAARDIGGSCLIASATTAAAFGSFAASLAQSFLHFGVIAAFGSMAALILCFSLLPVCLVGIPLGGRSVSTTSLAWKRALALVVDGAQRRSWLVIGGTLVLCAFAGVGLARLRLEVDVYHLFGEQTRVVRWIASSRSTCASPTRSTSCSRCRRARRSRIRRCWAASRSSRARSPRCRGSASRARCSARCAGSAACCTGTIPPSKRPPRRPPATPSCWRGSRGTTRTRWIAGSAPTGAASACRSRSRRAPTATTSGSWNACSGCSPRPGCAASAPSWADP